MGLLKRVFRTLFRFAGIRFGRDPAIEIIRRLGKKRLLRMLKEDSELKE